MNKVNHDKPTAGIVERIKLIRGGLGKAEFARNLNVSPSYITMIEQGKRSPGHALTELICQTFDINKKWLLTGEGPVRKEGRAPLIGPEVAPYKGELREAPVYALAGAGRPRELVDPEPVDRIVLPEEYIRPGVAPVRVEGESMEPTLYDGAVVGVDRNDRRPVSGKIYAVWLDYEGAVIKRLFVEPGRIELKSDNPGFPASYIDKKDVKDGFILGRVRWVVQKL